MPKDLFHDAVKQALLKEQWVITADPLIIKIEGVKLEIDLAAEKVFAAEKAGRKIAVEIKGFLNPLWSCVKPMTNPLPNHLNIERQIERCPGAIVCQNRNSQAQAQTQAGTIAERQATLPRLLPQPSCYFAIFRCEWFPHSENYYPLQC